MTETVVDLSAPEATMTTDEANRLATGLVGAAAAERDEEARRATNVGRVQVHVYDDVLHDPWLMAVYPVGPGGGVAVNVGPVSLLGDPTTLRDVLARAQEALASLREQSTGPVGG